MPVVLEPASSFLGDNTFTILSIVVKDKVYSQHSHCYLFLDISCPALIFDERLICD
jgi:hypothetical protein